MEKLLSAHVKVTSSSSFLLPPPLFLLPPLLLSLFPSLVSSPCSTSPSFPLPLPHSPLFSSLFLLPTPPPSSFIHQPPPQFSPYLHPHFLPHVASIFFISPYSIQFASRLPSCVYLSNSKVTFTKYTFVNRIEKDLKRNENTSFSRKFRNVKSRDRIWYISHTEIFKPLLEFHNFPSTMEQWHCDR